MIARWFRGMIAVRQAVKARAPRGRAIRPGVLVFAVAVAVLALPTSAGAYVYWANYNPGNGTTFGRANLDGSGANQSFITAATDSIPVAVDAQHIYWANTPAGTIGRANLDRALIELAAFEQLALQPLDGLEINR